MTIYVKYFKKKNPHVSLELSYQYPLKAWKQPSCPTSIQSIIYINTLTVVSENFQRWFLLFIRFMSRYRYENMAPR